MNTTNTAKSELNQVELCVLSAASLIASISTFKFIFMRYGLAVAGNMGCLTAGLFFAITTYTVLNKNQKKSEQDTVNFSWIFLSIPLVFLVYLGAMYWKGATLPANDPVANSTYAAILAKGTPLYQFYDVGQGGHSYPPGVPLLLSIVYAAAGSLWALYSFKVLCLMSVGLMPMSWAWAIKRIFNISIPLSFIAFAFYVSAFGIERTLNYALPFAGKNSQIIMLLIFPAFLVQLSCGVTRGYLSLLLAGFNLFGLILLHYSALHLAVATLLPIVIVGAIGHGGNFRAGIIPAIRITIVGVFAVLLFIFFFPSALHDTPSTLGVGYNFWSSLRTFWNTFFSPNESALAIFNNPSFQVIGSPARGYIIFASCLFCWAIARATEDDIRNIDSTKIATAALCCLCSLFVAVAFGAGLVNTGVNLDFARWFSFPLQYSVMACAMLCALMLIDGMRDKVARIICYFAVLLIPVVTIYQDTLTLIPAAKLGTLSSREILALKSDFLPFTGGCDIVAPNTAVDGGHMFAQKYRSIEYAEMVTPCTVVTGSWVHTAYGSWRDADGLPGLNAYGTVSADTALYFVGTVDELQRYGGAQHWQRRHSLADGAAIWERVFP
ncbi:hypothetical protein [Rhodanobacter umsongensis]